MLLPVFAFAEGEVELWGVSIPSFVVGVVCCKFAALNRGGASIWSFKSLIFGCFACKIWGRSQGRFSVVSLYVPTVWGERGRPSSGLSRWVSCFCFPNFDLYLFGIIFGCNFTTFLNGGRQSSSLLLTIYTGGRPMSLLEE